MRIRDSIKGTENKIPDTLSRVDVVENKTERDLKEIKIFRLSREDRLFGEELKDIKTMQRSDNKSGKIITSLEAGLAGSEYNQYFQIYQGILFKKEEGCERDWRLVITEGLIAVSYTHLDVYKRQHT